MPDSVGLGYLDAAVIAGYLALMAGVAWWARARERSTADYFLGGRNVPVLVAALSFMATALSAATFVGVPESSYRGDLSYLASNIGALLGVLIVAGFFIPVYYRLGVTTVYGLLERRFGRPASIAAGWTFLVGRLMASGARLYIAGLALAFLLAPELDSPLWLVGACAATMVAAGCCYTLVGGLRSVVWTDVLQALVFVVAAVATIAVLWQRIPLGFDGLWGLLDAPGPNQPSKLTVFKPGFGSIDPGVNYSLPAILLGVSLLNLGAYGTDQDLAQRLLACKDARRGAASAITAIVCAVPTTLLFLIVGLLLYVFYQRPDVMGDAAPIPPEEDRRVFLLFIATQLPEGLRGLLCAGLLATAVSSITSELNAMSATFVSDCYRHYRSDCDDAHYLRVGRRGVVVSAIALAVFATLCAAWHGGRGDALIDFALTVMVFAYAGLVGVFLAAIFTRRGTSESAILALAIGFLLICVGQFTAIKDAVAFPYQMFVATTAAFAICVATRPRDRHEHA